MKQILQHLRTGELELAEVPSPVVGRGQVLIQTRASLISAGTERMLVEFSQANLIQKARQQPDKVRQVLDKLKTDGVMPTLEAVFRKLDVPLPLGYCNAGVVLEVGPGVHDVHPGDRVISNGPHAEMVSVPRNLCAKIPDGVSDAEAAFTVLASIGLQGLRLVAPTLGERVVVFGVGLIGLITVQLLRASGCEVLAVDVNPERLARAEEYGAQTANPARGADPVTAAEAWTGGVGVDAVIICASAKTDDIVHQAAQCCRKRGRIVLVGVVGLQLRRDDFYKKELTFQVSCSYGPGRYDDKYEQAGQDYPLGYVRWTEGRNFEAILRAMASDRLKVDGLITHRFPLAEAVRAYETMQRDPSCLGLILEYPVSVNRAPAVRLPVSPSRKGEDAIVAVVGAGGFANGILLPLLKETPARIGFIADLNGAAAKYAAEKFGAEAAVTDYRLAFEDDRVRAVFVLTGHSVHARMVCEALEAGKHVFVEKPLAMNEEELERIIAGVDKNPDRMVMVGYNRRFSPHTVKAGQLLSGRSEPLCMSITVNGGAIPPDHWIQNPEVGGGRIIGEGCHFIDLLAHLAGSAVTSVSSAMVGQGPAVREDKMAIVLGFADGSVGTVNYFSNGAKSYPKETVEVFSDGRVLRMENFRVTLGFGFAGFKKIKTSRQDKGHRAEIHAFIDAVAKGKPSPTSFVSLVNTTRASFAAVTSARESKTIFLI